MEMIDLNDDLSADKGSQTQAGAPTPSAEPVDARRWYVLALLFLSIAVNLVDRQVLSVLAPTIRDELHLSNTQYSYIIVSFLLGLTLAQIPAGMMLDRRGSRFGLSAIMAFWSVANGLHSVARNVVDFCGLRFMMGVGECGNYSGGIKAISQWFPARERALAGGIFNSGTVIGAFIAPALIIPISLKFGWRIAFVIPSVLGLLWIIPWLMFYRDRAKTSAASVSASPLPLLKCRQVWGALLMRALSGPVMHFYWYWLPEYLTRERKLSLESLAYLAGIPFLFAGIGNIAGGWFSGHLMSRGWTADRARKLSFLIAAGLCSLSIFVPMAPGEVIPIALISTAAFGLSGFVATHIGMLTDLFPSTVLARVAGITGVGEGCVNMAVTLATGIVVDRFSYFPVFIAAGFLPALAAASLFIFIRRIERVPESALGA